MMISCCFFCVFAVLIDKVCLQITVEGVFGGSVVLPCSSTEHDLKLQDINVHWRQNGSIYVYDIIKGKDSMAEQDPRYKKRVKTSPDEYLKGNFSIKLTNLTHADAGKYICYITNSSDSQQESVRLIINAPTTEKGNKTTDQEIQEETRPDSVKKSCLWILVGILLTIILVILFIVIIFRRTFSNCLLLAEHGVGSDALE